MKLKYPKTSDGETTTRDKLIALLLSVGSEGIFPLEQQGRSAEDETAGYDLEPFAWPSTGFDIVSGTKGSNADAITMRILGHNTQGETKGATGTQGGAQTGNLIRSDIRVADCGKEKATVEQQVLRDWAEVNYGDPDLAPIMVPVTAEPMANVAAAQTIQFLAAAAPNLRQYWPGVDSTELLRGFKVPLSPTGAGAPVVDATPSDVDGKPVGAPSKATSLALTATDLATIARVNEGRASVGLDPIGEEEGGQWIAEHSAKLRSALPSAPGNVKPEDKAPATSPA